MPRHRSTARVCAQRRAAILGDIIRGEKHVKQIAADHGLSLSWCRNEVWRLGYHMMLVNEAERKAILELRKFAAAPKAA